MPPKQADASGQTAQKGSDALYIFDSLFHVTTPVVINVNEISAQTNDKPNTIVKRFSILRKRYPGLNIQTTASPSATLTTNGATVPATPGPRRGRPSAAPKTAAPKSTPKSSMRKNVKSKKATGKDDSEHDNDEEDEAEVRSAVEISDDESVSEKPTLPKRKRSASTASTSEKIKPLPKRTKQTTADLNETLSEAEPSVITTPKQNKQKAKQNGAKSVPKDQKRGSRKGKADLDAQAEEEEGMNNEISSDIIAVNSISASKHVKSDGDHAGDMQSAVASTDGGHSELPVIEKQPSTLKLPATSNGYAQSSLKHDMVHGHIYATTHIDKKQGQNLTGGQDAHHKDEVDTNTYESQMTNSQKATPVKMEINTPQTQEEPNIAVWNTTLLRKTSSDGPGNQIVGIDVGFDAMLNKLCSDPEAKGLLK